MPKHIRFRRPGLPKYVVFSLKILSASALIALIVLGVVHGKQWYAALQGLGLSSQGLVDQSVLDENQTLLPLSSTSTEETKEVIPIETRTELSPSPEPTAITPTQEDPLLALNTPIGKEIQFVIHRVAEGETTRQYADRYNTSVEAITAVNYYLPPSLWVDWLIIIPLHTTEVEGLPAFEAYLIEEEGITIEDLAEQLSTSAEEMCLYNGIESGHIMHEGEWVLVPREPRLP